MSSVKQNFTAREEQIKQREAKVEELNQQRVQELERISGLTSEQAKDYLLKTVEDDVKHDTARMIKELETQAKEEAAKKGKRVCRNSDSEVCGRSCCGDYNFGCTTSK